MEDRAAEAKSQLERNELFLLACARGLLGDAMAQGKGEMLQVEGLAGEGAELDVKDGNGRAALLFAACKGEVEVMSWLASKGADMDTEDPSGRSALHFAAAHNQDAAVKFLLDRKAWCDSNDSNDDTPLHLAARNKAGEAALRLQRGGAKLSLRNQRGLMAFEEAMIAGNLALAQKLLPEPDAWQDRPQGYSLLHVMAGLGKEDVVAFLLKKGLAVGDAANPDSLTPLHSAAMSGSQLTVSALLAAGADAAAADAQGFLPYQLVPDDDTPASAALVKQLRAAAKAAKPTSRSTSAANSKAAHKGEAELQAFLALPRGRQMDEIGHWAEMEEASRMRVPLLEARPALRKQVAGVRSTQQLMKAAQAVQRLHEDDDFQAALGQGRVRHAVEEVREDPNSWLRYQEDEEVMLVLHSLRRLRDVFRANGGMTVNLDTLLLGGTESLSQDEERVANLEQQLRSSCDGIVRELEAEAAGNTGGSEPSSSHPAAELQAAPDVGEEELLPGGMGRGMWKKALYEVARQTLLSLACMALAMLVMWYQNRLPWQRRALLKELKKAVASQPVAGSESDPMASGLGEATGDVDEAVDPGQGVHSDL